MSSKASTSKKDGDTPKLPAMETIITRRKSAQLKRQLRNKDHSILKINQMTQLLRSPTYRTQKPVVKLSNNSHKSVSPVKNKRKSISPVKNSQKSVSPVKSSQKSVSPAKNSQKSVAPVQICQRGPPVKTYYKSSQRQGRKARKSSEKNQKSSKSSERQSDMKEYYPNKLKRTVCAKKVVLKPKHELKVIATGVSKRKLAEPQKGYVSPVDKRSRPSSVAMDSSQKMTMEELIGLQDMESLNDEDLMEILTCPSPVWWENPPNANYDEDPIFIREPDNHEENEECNITNRVRNANYNDDSDKNLIENIRCNLKLPTTKGADEKFMKKRNKLENLLGNIKNKIVDETSKEKAVVDSDIPTKNDLIVVDTLIDNEETKLGEKFHIINLTSPRDKKHYTVNDDKTSESTEEDPFSSLRDDELLNHLENIDIPMESDEVLDIPSPCSSKDSFLGSGKDQHKLDPITKTNTETSHDANHKIDTKDHKTRSENNDCLNTAAPAVKKLKIMSIENVETLSTSLRIEISDDNFDIVSLVSSLEPDTISDTNITFIHEDDSLSSNSTKIVEKTDVNTKGKMNNPIKILKSEIGNLMTNMTDTRKRYLLEKIDKSHKVPNKNSLLRRFSLDMNNTNVNDTTDLKHNLEPLPLKQNENAYNTRKGRLRKKKTMTTVDPNISATLNPKEKFKQILSKLRVTNLEHRKILNKIALKAKPSDTKPSNTKPLRKKQLRKKPVKKKPVDTKPLDTKPISRKPILLNRNRLSVDKKNLESSELVTNGISESKPNLGLDSEQKMPKQYAIKSMKKKTTKAKCMGTLTKADIPKRKLVIPINSTGPTSAEPTKTTNNPFLCQSSINVEPNGLTTLTLQIDNFSNTIPFDIPIKKAQNISKIQTPFRPNREKTECMTVFKFIPKDKSNKNEINHELEASKTKNSDNAAKNTEDIVKQKDENKIKPKTNYFAEYMKVINSVKDRLDIFTQDGKKEEQFQTNNILEKTTEEGKTKNNVTDKSLPSVNNLDQSKRKDHEFKDHNYCEETENTDTFCDTCDPNPKKSIVVSNSSVKYCLKCSSIFDTDDCSYCQRKTENKEHTHSSETSIKSILAPTEKNHTDNNTEAKKYKESSNCAEFSCDFTANYEDLLEPHVVKRNSHEDLTNE